MKALEKDRTRRYETAAGLADDVQRYLKDEPVVARPPSITYKVFKFIHRNRTFVATTATMIFLLIVGITATSWFAYKASQSAKAERVQRGIADGKTKAATAATKKANDAQAETQRTLEKSNATLARSNYFLANARWNEGRALESMALLDAIPEKYREFEWCLCKRQFLGSAETLLGHADGVGAAS